MTGATRTSRIGGIPLDEAERIALGLSYRDRLAVTAWVFERLRHHWMTGGTYRAMLETFGFDDDSEAQAYRVLLAVGAIDVHNALLDAEPPAPPRSRDIQQR